MESQTEGVSKTPLPARPDAHCGLAVAALRSCSIRSRHAWASRPSVQLASQTNRCTPATSSSSQGHYTPSGSGNASICSDQIHVEKLTPAMCVGKANPFVFISAGVPSATVWLNTPDNRKGWASWFRDRGHQVYILGITANGRSG
jgi:hypothetical protein